MDDQPVNCSGLDSRQDFKDYIAAIELATGNNFTLARDCKTRICNALWGSGNPDISGVGMMAGYILENALGCILALFIIFCHRRQSVDPIRNQKLSSQYLNLALSTCGSFYDGAVFLTFSIQIASIIVLVRLNFGVSASGMGDITARITWAVSLLTMLPLVYVAYIPSLLREPNPPRSNGLESEFIRESRRNLRFILFVVCWLLSMYPFLSRMISTFGPSFIGAGNTKVISNDNWAILEATCFSKVSTLTDTEITAINVCGVSGSLLLSLLTTTKILWLALQRQHPDSRLSRIIRKRFLDLSRQEHRLEHRFTMTLLVIIPAFCISQIWTLFRLRQLQTQMSTAAGNSDLDGEWTFGQIVALTVFFPALVESWFSWLHRSR